MKYMQSTLIYTVIQIERIIDHIYRYATGLPQVKKSLITPNLYLGGQYSLRAFPRLQTLGVTGIVNMRLHSVHKDIVGLGGVKVLNLPTPDRKAPSQEALAKGVEFIKKEIASGGKVYIHCKFGEGRGPTMAIAYLISTGMTYEDAFTLVKKIRTFIDPTKDQRQALKEFEKNIPQQTPPLTKI
jgi:protein-tyrosine phosphatase